MSINNSNNFFDKIVKPALEWLLRGRIVWFEQDTSDIASSLGRSAAVDFVVFTIANSDDAFFGANRIANSSVENCKRFSPSLTIRNSVSGGYQTELNKIISAVRATEGGIPVIVPRFLCQARIYQSKSGRNIYDLIAVETIPLFRHIASASRGIDLGRLRDRYEQDGSDGSVLLFGDEVKMNVGIRSSGNDSFVFFEKKYFDRCALPYHYHCFDNDIGKTN